jgi:6-pyruvoyltetrahydropterin/6-carboxytetrahydropterin synthase
MYTLQKKFRFESAHRLGRGYTGKCRNIHGHSWNGVVAISFGGLGAYDMAIDFSEIGKFLKGVEDRYDHKLLLYEMDEDVINFCQINDMAFETFEGNPTSEVLAETIHGMLVKHLDSIYVLGTPKHTYVAVTIEETCTSACTYTG